LSHCLDKGDLSFDAEAFIDVADLRRRQARGLQKRTKIEPGGARLFGREAG